MNERDQARFAEMITRFVDARGTASVTRYGPHDDVERIRADAKGIRLNMLRR
ncbi:hypothetical protein [Bradyrhizobium sp. I1.7.5]|uniref:hypothetical protein n=1 Tax=Bradyrhizobium sp. I1.7.5 TaxID=3156363 RepID=UPI00339A9D4F